jgi:RNA polymerase sigma-70 factor (ECF subfamily)
MEKTAVKKSIDTLPGGLLITDTQSRVLYASQALERRTGFAVAEIIGKKPGQLWGGKMEKEFYVHLWQTIAGKKEPFVGEVHNTKKNGAQNNEHIFILPLLNDQGEVAYFAEIHPDFSHKEEEIEFGREFLARAKSMKNRKEFFFWIFEQLQKKKDGTEHPLDTASMIDHCDNVAQFFQETLVGPTEELFSSRKEDALLVAEAQANPEKFAALYEKYAPKVREYFLRRLSGDRVLAEDLAQEVFIKAFRYFPGFRMGNASYYTYLLHVAHSVLVNHYRKREYQTFSHEACGELPQYGASEMIFEEDVEKLLRILSPTEKEVMLLKYRDDLRVKEIATQLGKTENAVKLILSRSRKKLKQKLEKSF